MESASCSSTPLAAAAPSSSAYALIKLHFKEDLSDAEIDAIVQILNCACGELLGQAERVKVAKTIKSNPTSLLVFLPVALVDLLVMFLDLKVLDTLLLSS